MSATSRYQVLEVQLADTRRHLTYKIQSQPEIQLNLKGFDYAWINAGIPTKPGLRVLDVGSGYSWLPSYLARERGCEVWSVDDFAWGEPRSSGPGRPDPQEHIRSHPEVRYVVGRLGPGQRPDLPERYFDYVVSASTLEHVPADEFGEVWRHMDRLLRPGGDMLHAIDVAFPTSRGLPHVFLALAFDLIYPLIPRYLRTKYTFETPLACVRSALHALRIRTPRVWRRLNVVRLVLDPQVAIEPVDATLARHLKDGDTRLRHFRVGSLLIHIRKAGDAATAQV